MKVKGLRVKHGVSERLNAEGIRAAEGIEVIWLKRLQRATPVKSMTSHRAFAKPIETGEKTAKVVKGNL
jgi:hypothetical protein